VSVDAVALLFSVTAATGCLGRLCGLFDLGCCVGNFSVPFTDLLVGTECTRSLPEIGVVGATKRGAVDVLDRGVEIGVVEIEEGVEAERAMSAECEELVVLVRDAFTGVRVFFIFVASCLGATPFAAEPERKPLVSAGASSAGIFRITTFLTFFCVSMAVLRYELHVNLSCCI
jgi:hypothetical protein